MCGILCFKGNDPAFFNRFEPSLALMNHRGPDNMSTLRVDENTTLGHVRLSIIDLEEHSNQPMESERSVLVFNGEIYNYLELREILIGKGVVFETHSDTEVLQRLLEMYGSNAVEMLNGMWAFYYIDKLTNDVIVSRDRFGKKPLYYYADSETYVFGSETQAIFRLIGKGRALCRDYLEAFLCYYYWPNVDNRTFYQDIFKVMPGEVITFNNKGPLQFHRSSFNSIENFVGANDSVVDLKRDLADAVRIRLRADVPVGIFLSGGVDSTAVASFAALNDDVDIRWFTGNTGGGKDLEFSRSVASSLGVSLTELDISYDDSMVARIEAMTRIYDLPPILLGNSVAMNTLFEAVSQSGIKVVLDGTGGDELFGGYFDFYGKYLINTLIERRQLNEFLGFVKSSKKYGSYSLLNVGKYTLIKLAHSFLGLNIYPPAIKSHNVKAARSLSSSRAHDFATLNEFTMSDMRFGRLQMWLTMNDSNSMMYSVESRSPLLDYRLLKYQAVEANYKFRDGFNKYLLRSAIAGNAPQDVTWRRDKQGFRWSSSLLISNNLNKIKELIFSSSLVRSFFDENELRSLFAKKISPTTEAQILRLYSVAVFECVTGSYLV